MSTKLTAYIDVNFTMEEDLSNFTDKDREMYLKNKANIIEIYKADLLTKLNYYAHNIKDLDVTLTFEEVN